jgi:hypothetical protein
MTSDSSCPSPELLRRSLDPDDPMPERERRQIEAHVAGCTRGCKPAIEALLRSNSLGAPGTTRPDDFSFTPPGRRGQTTPWGLGGL